MAMGFDEAFSTLEKKLVFENGLCMFDYNVTQRKWVFLEAS